jgi:chemotaxis regulatin CheY-phosphate phosphatase CheZ
MAAETGPDESLEKVLRDSYDFFGDLSDKVRDSVKDAERDFTSEEKKEDIAQFYREKLSSFGRDDIEGVEKEIRREANRIGVSPKTVARFCLTEKLSKKGTLLISRDKKLLNTVRSEEKKCENLSDSSMLRKFISSQKNSVYNMRDQLNLYKSSIHGFEALRQLAEKFRLDKEIQETAEDLKSRAQIRVSQVEDMIELGGENPEKAIEELESLVNSFSSESREITDAVNDLREVEKD